MNTSTLFYSIRKLDKLLGDDQSGDINLEINCLYREVERIDSSIKSQTKIYKMSLHEVVELDPPDKSAMPFSHVMRVAGGWIYLNWDGFNQEYNHRLFIPFDNDMQ